MRCAIQGVAFLLNERCPISVIFFHINNLNIIASGQLRIPGFRISYHKLPMATRLQVPGMQTPELDRLTVKQ